MRVVTALFCLASHWIYKPLQLFALLVGLSLATGLWSGVQAINSEARNSYNQSKEAVLPEHFETLERRDGGLISPAIFVALQRAGWRTSPLLEGVISFDGWDIQVIGIDLATLPNGVDRWVPEGGQASLTEFVAPPYVVMASPATLYKIEGISGSGTPASRDLVAAKAATSDNIVRDTVIVDIAFAQKLLPDVRGLTRLVLASQQTFSRPNLGKVAPQLVRIASHASGDLERLTASFHLNLTAFGLLAFCVGLFIVQGAISLAFEQRRGMCRTMRVGGLSLRELVIALLLELLILALIAGVAGVFLGYVVAALLLPDVAATLRGLYGAEVSGELAFRMEWWATGLVIAVAGTMLAAIWSLKKLISMPLLTAVHPRAWAMASQSTNLLRLSIAITVLAIAGIVWSFGTGLVMAFVTVGLFLMGGALLMPLVVRLIANRCQLLAARPVSQWFWADTNQQLPGLSLALMALLLALATNIGVSTMVGSFRLTFSGWLDQRLAAELYVRATDAAQARQLRSWLEQRSDAVLPVWHVRDQLQGRSGQIYGFADHETYRENWPMLELTRSGWDDVAAGRAALINEQLARGANLKPGQLVELGTDHTLPVAGIYSDFGNPQPQAMINVALLTKWYPGVQKLRHSVRVDPENTRKLANDIRREFGLTGRNLVDQETIKRRSLEIFERTFLVTGALNALTLLVAGFALFTSLLTQASLRLPQLAPLWSMGLTRSKLAGLELLRAVLLAAISVVLALPFGLGLAWLLLTLVNVEAFGWRLPMFVFVKDWLLLAGYALVATVIAAAIPAWRIRSIDPADLVKVFAHER